MTTFDASRANLSSTDMFDPFHIEFTQSLQRALDEGDVAPDTSILAVERDGGTLTLLTQQMAYHHVAQGEMAGVPWLVSF
jgi:hypothetical protein